MYQVHTDRLFVTDGGVDALMNTANEIKAKSSEDVQKTLNEQMDQVTQNPSARNIGRLAETVRAAGNQIKTSVGPSQDAVRTATNQTNTPIDPAEVTHTLRTKGISERQAGGIAEAIVARLNGQELTRPQRNLLNFALSSSAVRDTISDLMQKKTNTVDSAKKRMYDKDGIDNGLTNEEKAVLWNSEKHGADTLGQGNDTTATAGISDDKLQNASSGSALEGDADVIDDVITDGSHLENGRLKPNVTYKTGEHDYFYTTNEDGLIVNARTDDLQLKDHEGRHKHNPNTYGKEQGDHAGHLFGDRFGGSPELDNLVSQAKNVNLSEYRAIENHWASALKNGQKVRVNIDVHYDQGGVRPSSFDVSYTIDDVYYYHEISN